MPMPAFPALDAIMPRLRAASVVVGFDGFVDEMIGCVRERTALDAFTPVATIGEFAQLAAAAAGRSSCREIVIRETAAGGCAVNLGDGLAGLGVTVDCFATLGRPMHPAFAGFAAKCRTCESWGDEPGRTLAFEFGDGKLMYPAVAPLARFTPEHLRACLADGRYAQAVTQAHTVAFTNWSLYPHMTTCWRVVQSDVLRAIPAGKRPAIFIDLVDPSARSGEDIRAMLEALGGNDGFAALTWTTLGINLNEAGVLAQALGLARPDPSDLAGAAARLRKAIGVQAIVLHTHHQAIEATADGTAGAASFHTDTPVRSVGAGDRFNAGYIAGGIIGLTGSDRCRFACAVAGAFVRHGASVAPARAMALMTHG